MYEGSGNLAVGISRPWPDGRVREQLTRGARIREALRQSQHMPFRLADEVALMLAVQAGLLDPLPLAAVAAFRTALLAFARSL